MEYRKTRLAKIATVALEVCSVSEPMREACQDVFESWLAAGSARFT
ncbi:MAG: LmrA/YxaF family transcription factor [Solirubrobacteraceae bacterium]